MAQINIEFIIHQSEYLNNDHSIEIIREQLLETHFDHLVQLIADLLVGIYPVSRGDLLMVIDGPVKILRIDAQIKQSHEQQ